MSHGIGRRDIVLAVGTTAWHGLAEEQGEAFTLDLVRANPAFNFAVETSESAFRNPVTNGWESVDNDRYTLRRDPDGTVTPFGRVSKDFTVFDQPSSIETAAEIERALGGVLKFDTAGTLYDGARCWLQAKLDGQDFEIKTKLGAKFGHVARFTMMWGHDGRTPVLFKGNQTCLVCWNTTELGLNEKTSEIRIAHTAGVEKRVKEAVRYLTELPGTLVENQQVLQTFADTPMTIEAFEEFASAIILGIDVVDPTDRRAAIETELRKKQPIVEGGTALTTRALTNFSNALDAYRHEFLRRADVDGAGRTVFAAESAVTAIVDHPTNIQEWISAKKASYQDSVKRVAKLSRAADEAMFGSGAALKRRARQLLLRTVR